MNFHKGVCCIASPIVKWAGGKRQLIPEITARMPETFGTYYEPFFGGGALYFNQAPERAVINDFNSQLMNVYNQIRESPSDVISFLAQYQNEYNQQIDNDARANCYYKNRDIFNNFIKNNTLTSESAALFVFLNKAGLTDYIELIRMVYLMFHPRTEKY